MIKRQTAEHSNCRSEIVTADTIEEALNYVMPRIRSGSQNFYDREIRRELAEEGSALIDRHAGQGTYFDIRIRS